MNNTLQLMFECLAKGDPVFQPSKFWEELNAKNLKQLEIHEIKSFKQTIALNYFTWLVGPRDKQFLYLIRNTKLRSWPEILSGAFQKNQLSNLNRIQQIQLTIFTRMLWKFVQQFDHEKLLDSIEEPTLGNPFNITLNNKLISQDIANSVLEYYSIREQFKPEKTDKITVGELGAGYGRNSYLLLKIFPNCRYIIIDIPPALYVSQQYLSALFPLKKIFHFRCFNDYHEVREEIENASIVFLLPHQAKMLPKKCIDLFINISSLHEMKQEQINEYFKLIDRLTKNLFYSKQWLLSKNSFDGIVIKKDDYPVPSNWQMIYNRKPKVQVHFFESMYKID